ncbi:MAG: aminomethyltransferase beta-barrel domain-containing protein [Burkholderiaceae bacterium]
MAAKTRYRQADAACALQPRRPMACGWTSTQPQWAVTPGQSAVLYRRRGLPGWRGDQPRGATRATGTPDRHCAGAGPAGTQPPPPHHHDD